jgi:hypothetical protein
MKVRFPGRGDFVLAGEYAREIRLHDVLLIHSGEAFRTNAPGGALVGCSSPARDTVGVKNNPALTLERPPRILFSV